MFDFFMAHASDELLSQAEYINGALYLPASAFFDEVSVWLGALLFASFLLLVTGILSEVCWCFSCWLYRRFKKQ